MPPGKGKRKVYTVGPDPKGGWRGEARGSTRAVAKGDNKAEVVNRTIEVAKKQPKAEVRIKGKNGRIQEERTYPRLIARGASPPIIHPARRRTKRGPTGIEGVVATSLVTDRLTELGVPYEVIPHEQAYTSIDEALALGISADEVVKTIVLDTASGHALAVIPGSRRLDISAAEMALGTKHVRLATEEEIEKDFSGYELGALPPLGSLHGAPTYVDPEVMQHDTVVFAAGTQTESVKVRTEDLFRNEPVTMATLTRLSADDDGLPNGTER